MPQESKFVEEVETTVRGLLSTNFHVKRGASLLYRLNVSEQLNIPLDVREPKRGNSAFETDLCVFERRVVNGGTHGNTIDIPRVVLEIKTSITTHDVLTYSAKVKGHKQIYPYLRYGIVSIEKNLQDRFFTHNEALDFYVAAKDMSPNEFQEVINRLIRTELRYSELLGAVAFKHTKSTSRVYQTVPVFDFNYSEV
jgi:hypothetical protein